MHLTLALFMLASAISAAPADIHPDCCVILMSDNTIKPLWRGACTSLRPVSAKIANVRPQCVCEFYQ